MCRDPCKTRGLGWAPLLILAMLVLAGCSATVSLPDAGAIEEARPVFLVEHGWHTSLVLVRDDDSLVRYVYGEWRWYARQETGAWRVFPTLFVRTPGALGRVSLDPPATERSLRVQTRVAVDAVHEFAVAGGRVDTLLEQLDERFESAIDTREHSEAYGLDFVRDEQAYTLWRNSNHLVADWLTQLGIDVRGNPVFGRWNIDRQGPNE